MSYRDTSASRFYVCDDGMIDLAEVAEMWKTHRDTLGGQRWLVRFRGNGTSSPFPMKVGDAVFAALRAYRAESL